MYKVNCRIENPSHSKAFSVVKRRWKVNCFYSKSAKNIFYCENDDFFARVLTRIRGANEWRRRHCFVMFAWLFVHYMIILQYDFWLFRGVLPWNRFLQRGLTDALPLKYCFGVAFVRVAALLRWNWADRWELECL